MLYLENEMIKVKLKEYGCGNKDPNMSKGPPDTDEDGVISPEELYYHFDLDDDGTVTPDEYEEHVKWHAEHPEYFDGEEEQDALVISLEEKKDRCYRLAKQKYDVFPSAYASGFIVRCRKGKVARKKKVSEELELDLESLLEEGTFDKEKSQGLHGWFARQGGKGKSKGWVDCNTCRTDKKTGRKTCKSCGRQSGESRGKYPACRPTPSACNKTGTSKKKSSTRVSWKPKKKKDE